MSSFLSSTKSFGDRRIATFSANKGPFLADYSFDQ